MKKLNKTLKKYKEIHDIIVFGSYVKGKYNPKDIDLAFILDKRDLNLFREIKKDINNERIHIDMIPANDLLYQSVFKGLLTEGYSIKNNKYLRDMLNIQPKKVYFYNLKDFDINKKIQFSKALTKTLKKIKGDRIGAGAVAIPINQSGYFEDFLDVWEMKYKTKEWTVF